MATQVKLEVIGYGAVKFYFSDLSVKVCDFVVLWYARVMHWLFSSIFVIKHIYFWENFKEAVFCLDLRAEFNYSAYNQTLWYVNFTYFRGSARYCLGFISLLL